MERLQKILSQAGVASRRASEKLMIDGRVTVNGATVRSWAPRPTRRATTSGSTAAGSSCRSATLPARQQAERIRDHTIGSAETAHGDRSAEGCARVRLPRWPARLRLGRPADSHQRRRPGGEAHAPAPRRAARVRGDGARASRTTTMSSASERRDDRRAADRAGRGDAAIGPSRLRITVREGRNRQVRKMCDAIGHPVTQLRRVAIGPIRTRGSSRARGGRSPLTRSSASARPPPDKCRPDRCRPEGVVQAFRPA